MLACIFELIPVKKKKKVFFIILLIKRVGRFGNIFVFV